MKHIAKTDTMVENSARVAAVVVIVTDFDDSINRSPFAPGNSIVIKVRAHQGAVVGVVVFILRSPFLCEATECFCKSAMLSICRLLVILEYCMNSIMSLITKRRLLYQWKSDVDVYSLRRLVRFVEARRRTTRSNE